MRLWVVGKDEKCGWCNWASSVVYMFGETEDDACAVYDVYGCGVCGNCIAERIMQDQYEVEI